MILMSAVFLASLCLLGRWNAEGWLHAAANHDGNAGLMHKYLRIRWCSLSKG
jgi:hypothetical protein